MADLFRLARLGQTTTVATLFAEKHPVIQNKPHLPIIDFAAMGAAAPGLPDNPVALPEADVVVICWAEAEWAPLHHVFVAGGVTMAYSAGKEATWPGWTKFADDLPAHPPEGINYWGYYRLVTIGAQRVLLFKSNAHLSEGQAFLEGLVTLLLDRVKPKLVLSTGTAGGARVTDHVGTVVVVDGGTLYEKTGAASTWPVYKSAWKPAWTRIASTAFRAQLFPVPTTPADLASLVQQFNQNESTTYTLADLDPKGLNAGAAHPAVDDLAPATTLLTASSFVVADTSGNYQGFACVEMDDAILAKLCTAAGVAFGSVRNVSDPAQAVGLPAKIQGAWGSFVYGAYGFYTSYNGALAAWGILSP